MDAHDEQYRTKQGLRWWPENELVRFIGKTYGTVCGLRGDPQRRAVDLGCGTGRHSWLLYESGFDVVGIDASAAAVGIAEEFLEERCGAEGVTFQVADVLAWLTAAPESSYQLVVDVQVLQHVNWLQKADAFREIARVLRPGGHFWSMHWCGLPQHAQAIYGGAYPELDLVTVGEMQEVLAESGFMANLIAYPYTVTRCYPALRATASWMIIEAVKA